MVAETRLLLDAPECVQHGDKLRPKSRRVMLRVVAILAVGCRSVEEGNARTSQRHNQGCRELGRTSGSDWVGEPWTFCENLRSSTREECCPTASANVRPSVKTRQKYSNF